MTVNVIINITIFTMNDDSKLLLTILIIIRPRIDIAKQLNVIINSLLLFFFNLNLSFRVMISHLHKLTNRVPD